MDDLGLVQCPFLLASANLLGAPEQVALNNRTRRCCVHIYIYIYVKKYIPICVDIDMCSQPFDGSTTDIAVPCVYCIHIFLFAQSAREATDRPSTRSQSACDNTVARLLAVEESQP